MADYLTYWRFGTVANHPEGPIDHAASEQFGDVRRGDVLWIVTFDKGTLYLVGRLEVGETGDQEDALKRFGRDVWEATYHLFAAPGTAAPKVLLDLTDVAPQLSFAGRVKQLPPHFTWQSFRSKRRLTSDGADLMEDFWQAGTSGKAGRH